MLWTFLWLLCRPVPSTASDNTFYRAITSGICEENADCMSFNSQQCEGAFNLMSSISEGSPRPQQYRDPSSSLFRPEGCLPDFNTVLPSLQFNDFSEDRQNDASTYYPVYCLCSVGITNTDFELEFKQMREEFESSIEWCDGWMGNIEIDPTPAWIEGGGSGTPRVLSVGLGSNLESRGIGFTFQPGAAFSESSLKSVGVRFLELAEGVELLATLRGFQSCDRSSGAIVCEGAEPSILFSDMPLTPGRGDEETVYFVDLYDLMLNVSWTYYLEFLYPVSFVDVVSDARLPVWHPVSTEPWAYEYDGAVYFDSLEAFYIDLETDEYSSKLPFPQFLFKLCSQAAAEKSVVDATGCDGQDFFSFNCPVWIYLIIAVVLATGLLGCCCFCCRTSQKIPPERPQMSSGLVPTQVSSEAVYLNFIDFDTGERWHRRDVPISLPIKLLCIGIAETINRPPDSTSLWLAPGTRLKWCYRVGHYKLSESDLIYIVNRPCNSICGCWSIEDLICCIPPPDFRAVPRIANEEQTQMTRLVRGNQSNWVVNQTVNQPKTIPNF